MRIRKIKGDFAEVESGRLIRTINVQMLPQLKIGDYCIVHAGFAIERVDPERAKGTLKIINEIPLETFSKRDNRRFLTG